MTMRTIEQAGKLQGKTVFMRADFDVPVAADGTITETFRIERQRPMLAALIDAGAHVVIGAHIAAVPSFTPLRPQLERILGIAFGDSVTLLENLRANPGEESDDDAFARELVAGCDVYVNNAFAVCHRDHASVSTAAQLIPSYAGTLVSDEVANLRRVIDTPSDGKVIFMGGAKVSTKEPVIANLLDKAQTIALGGKVAVDFAGPADPRIRMPEDFAQENLDIGPMTAAAFAHLAAGATMIVWNGPMGKFEDDRYAAGTRALAEAIASSRAFSVVGGGDTIAALTKFGMPLDRFGFVSTGGGAMLAFLAGADMPGLRVLGYTP